MDEAITSLENSKRTKNYLETSGIHKPWKNCKIYSKQDSYGQIYQQNTNSDR
jgi:hypothetical protein